MAIFHFSEIAPISFYWDGHKSSLACFFQKGKRRIPTVHIAQKRHGAGLLVGLNAAKWRAPLAPYLGQENGFWGQLSLRKRAPALDQPPR